MSETVGSVMGKLFGEYDYVAFQDQHQTVIRKWDDVSAAKRCRSFQSFTMKDGLEMSKRVNVPSDDMTAVYLLFRM